MSSTFKYVVVGAGNSAGYVAKAFAERTPPVAAGELLLVGREAVAPYERPALSKAFLFADPPARLPGFHTSVGGGGSRQDPAWYEEKGIKLMLNSNVTAFDAGKKTLTLESGENITGENIILATGAAPVYLTRIQGHDLNGIHYLRENEDGLKLYEALKKSAGKTVIVVGGGYIGLETAAAACMMGLKVKMVFPEEHVMPRLFTPEIAEQYEAFYKAKGVELFKNGRLCSEFLPDGNGGVRGIIACKDDDKLEIPGDLVIVGVGAIPNIQLFKDQLEMDKGVVKVDGRLQTSAPGVYAIGDIASFPLKMYGGETARMEHVAHARASAKHVVDVLGGSTEAYDYLPFFYSRVFNLSWQFFGQSAGATTLVGDIHSKMVVLWTSDGKVNGVFMEQPSADDTAAMKEIALKRPSVDVSAVAKSDNADAALAIVKAALA